MMWIGSHSSTDGGVALKLLTSVMADISTRLDVKIERGSRKLWVMMEFLKLSLLKEMGKMLTYAYKEMEDHISRSISQLMANVLVEKFLVLKSHQILILCVIHLESYIGMTFARLLTSSLSKGKNIHMSMMVTKG